MDIPCGQTQTQPLLFARGFEQTSLGLGSASTNTVVIRITGAGTEHTLACWCAAALSNEQAASMGHLYLVRRLLTFSSVLSSADTRFSGCLCRSISLVPPCARGGAHVSHRIWG